MRSFAGYKRRSNKVRVNTSSRIFQNDATARFRNTRSGCPCFRSTAETNFRSVRCTFGTSRRSHATDFRRQLYDALLLYSRNSTAPETSDKLVFVLVSLESMLLRDSTEPITKNIGERVAFLIGTSIEERKRVIQNVDDAYGIRSKFISHGNSVEDSELIEQFFAHAWQCFYAMLGHIGSVDTKAALIEALERCKLSADKL